MHVEITSSARKHGVSDPDIIHAFLNYWRGFETSDEGVTLVVGPSRRGTPLEIGVVLDADGSTVVHAMAARRKFLRGWQVQDDKQRPTEDV